MLGNNYEKFLPEWVATEGACSKCGSPILRNTVVVLQTPTGDKYWVKCSSTKCAHMEKHPPESPVEAPPKQEILLEESTVVTEADVLPIKELPMEAAIIEVAPIEQTFAVDTIEKPIIEAAPTQEESHHVILEVPTIEEEPAKETTLEPTPEAELIKEVAQKVEPIKIVPTKEVVTQDATIEVVTEVNNTLVLVNSPQKKQTNKKGNNR